MDLGLRGKNILITASNGGLGPSLASHFAHEGANLYLVSRDQGRLENLRDKVSRGHDHVVEIQSLDLARCDAPQVLSDELSKRKFEPDVLIHHLGGTLGVTSALSAHADWSRVLWTNAQCAMEINRCLIERLKSREWARIVHISSISSRSLRGSAPYACAKALLDAYTVALARELAETKVVVSAVLPGALWSEGGPWDNHQKNNPQLVADFLRHHHASGRLGTAAEVAPTVLFLASKWNTFSQGALVNIDGGTM